MIDTAEVPSSEFEDGHRTDQQRWLWPVAILLGMIVLELTSSPALSVSVGCLKYSLEGLLAAWHRLRNEPDRVGGRVVAYFSVAWGFWKTTGIAIVVMLAVLLIHGWVEHQGGAQRNGGPPREFVTAALIALIGATVSSAMSFVAVAAALSSGVRVWIGSRRNHALDVITAGLVVPAVISSIALVFGAMHLAPDSKVSLAVFLLISTLCWYVLLPFGILCLRDILAQRILVASPMGTSRNREPGQSAAWPGHSATES